jgi:hypothetical protein
MSDGTQQTDRFPAALQEGYFRVDELRFEDRVALSADLAAQLDFHDLELQRSGTWAEMFGSDEALALARIMSVDVAALQARFMRDVDTAPTHQLALQVGRLAGWLDLWFKTLKVSDSTAARTLCERLAAMVRRQLAGDLQGLLEHFGSGSGAPPEAARLMAHTHGRLDPIWHEAHALAAPAPQRPPRELLRTRFVAFVTAITRLQELAREQLPGSLRSEAHEPAAGLFVAFLQLFETAQRSLNRFTSRHVDFYYDDCLRMPLRPAQPDLAHLVCQRDQRAAREVLVPRGTAFAAGKDAQGRTVEFVAEDTLLVTDAQVADLRTLRLERDPLISPEREFDHVTRAKALQIPVLPPGGAVGPGNGNGTPPAWPLFGGSDPALPGRQGEDARLGLAIATPMLWLQEGERDIRVVLRFEHADQSDPDTLALLKLPPTRRGAPAEWLKALFTRYLMLDLRLLGDAAGDPVNGSNGAQGANGTRGAAAAAGSDAARAAAQATVLAASAAADAAAWARLEADPDPASASYRAFLLQLLQQAGTRELFFTRLGCLFGRWLLAPQEWLDGTELAAVRQVAARWLDADNHLAPDAGDPIGLVRGLHVPERDLVFDHVFNGMFAVSLTTATGWLDVTDAFIVRARAEAAAAGNGVAGNGNGAYGSHGNGHASPLRAACGLELVLRLPPEAPPITGCNPAVHGPLWPAGLPVLRLQIQAQARMYPYSLLADLKLAEATVSVDVRGVRELSLYNQLGRLDATKPFHPFGPLPTVASYLVLGAPEAARKNLTALRLNLEWGELPLGDGGFGEHYAGYDAAVDNDSFTATVSILRDSAWQAAVPPLPPATTAATAPTGQLLFATADAGGRLAPMSHIDVDPAALAKHCRTVDGELLWGPAARNGFFRLQLAGPAGAFGHQAYPGLLTRAVAHNARRPGRPLPVPNAPYTPVLERLTLDYSARRSLHLGRDTSADASEAVEGGRVLHLHPFGIEEIYPRRSSSPRTVLPHYPNHGHLLIGLSASELQGPLSLLFHLRDESAGAVSPRPPRLRWSCLAADGWRPLPPERVLSDTTGGFLTTGIVTLDLPADLRRGGTALPADLYWLCVSTDRGFGTFAGLYGVHAQALRVRRAWPAAGPAAAPAPTPAANPAAEAQPIPAGTIKEPIASLPGLLGVLQVGASFGLRGTERRDTARTRIGERLRHKNRASTPWDYERLVLDRFDQVFKVKCFAHTAAQAAGPASAVPVRPGQVLVVVVPAVRRNDPHDSTLGPRLNAIDLQRIADHLRSLAAPAAHIAVVNAVYERIQVRCTVGLARGVHVGRSVRLINQAIVEYLSPWHDGGYSARFDWVVRCEDIETRLRDIEGVEFVTKVSLLHVAMDERGTYTLGDTARAPAPRDAAAAASAGHVRPRCPWSIALPMRQHIVTAVDAYTDARPEPTGIARLAIGSTFIVGGGAA